MLCGGHWADLEGPEEGEGRGPPSSLRLCFIAEASWRLSKVVMVIGIVWGACHCAVSYTWQLRRVVTAPSTMERHPGSADGLLSGHPARSLCGLRRRLLSSGVWLSAGVVS